MVLSCSVTTQHYHESSDSRQCFPRKVPFFGKVLYPPTTTKQGGSTSACSFFGNLFKGGKSKKTVSITRKDVYHFLLVTLAPLPVQSNDCYKPHLLLSTLNSWDTTFIKLAQCKFISLTPKAVYLNKDWYNAEIRNVKFFFDQASVTTQ